ncbi:hypothetical protein QBC40DRAFT_289920 [Triangularia verruculosa]|uniref:Uncharacterized protein n=1 Tax=Triangularia verruculosa TaxID=2587418 RepID=A0AAN6X743_9PEZI|nr:hypothetical protein QBC40DRAFT_289920 [Triangularia verruculosa]
MDTRFNSFYHDDLHTSVRHCGAIFTEFKLQRRSNRPTWHTAPQWTANRQLDENNAFIPCLLR